MKKSKWNQIEEESLDVLDLYHKGQVSVAAAGLAVSSAISAAEQFGLLGMARKWKLKMEELRQHKTEPVGQTAVVAAQTESSTAES